MLYVGLACSYAQTTDYAARVKTNIQPWVESTGKIFGLSQEGLTALQWSDAYTTSCTAEEYNRMLAVVNNPRYYFCPTGYYRLKSDRGGYLYLEGNNPQTENNAYNASATASSIVKLERMSDGGFYIRMQGQYVQIPEKNMIETVSFTPVKFYPVVKTPGEKVAFTTRTGTYSALHCGTAMVQGWTLDDDASYWKVTSVTDFTLTSNLFQDNKYYATLYAPFATRPVPPVAAYTLTEKDGKAVAQSKLEVVPDSTGVLLRSSDYQMQVQIADDNHDDVPGNVVLRNAVADSSYYYFNKAFLLWSGMGNDNYTYYRETQIKTNKLYFWQQALVILMVEDRYDFRGDPSVAPLIAELLDAFSAHEGGRGVKTDNSNSPYDNQFSQYAHNNGLSDWTWNEYNDDLLWAGIAFIRGYLITKQQRFLDQAKWTFDYMYTRGYDTKLNGGIWWSKNKNEKSGLSNNPAVCMACYLYEATGNEDYLNKAIGIYNWVYNTLRRSDGAVDEKINADGSKARSYNVYNQGTFIEGASLLYKITGEANYRKAALGTFQYVMTSLVDNRTGLMSRQKYDGTWQSEFARGAAALLKASPADWNYSCTYTNRRIRTNIYDWMRLNADAAWNTRDRVNNITGCVWTETTPTVPADTRFASWECDACVSAVVMTNVVPEVRPGSGEETYVTLDNETFIQE